MALWGNTDAISVESGGTISINYGNLTVTGAGTSFGVTGFAQTGDILRVGSRVGTGTYFGDAVIVAIASTISCTIGSTIGLAGGGPNAQTATGSTTFQVSRYPKSAVLDESFSEIKQTGISSDTALFKVSNHASGVGTDFVFIDTSEDPPIIAGDMLINNDIAISVSSVGSTSVSLASTISAAIADAQELKFKRFTGGYQRNVYAVAQGGKENAAGSAFQVDHTGWVGVTTYTDSEGNLRVKKETLVAMSGITTGNTPLYDSNPF